LIWYVHRVAIKLKSKRCNHGVRICPAHLDLCNRCGNRYCIEHMTMCHACEDDICLDAACKYQCDNCDADTCYNCLHLCEFQVGDRNCRNTICVKEECMNECVDCHLITCSVHQMKCAQCGDSICKHCTALQSPFNVRCSSCTSK
jgi:hypothetical protein